MYKYTDFDRAFLRQRIKEFSMQTRQRIDGVLSEDEYKPLRLQHGLYLQLHAYMLRVAIPYGTLNSRQMEVLADIADKYDRGWGHFTTRQNIQFNWTKLTDVEKILNLLAEADMHSIQTSGNCIRNVTADHFAGAIGEEIEDPRITAELLRQWSTGHPEYAFLPRKFKIAVTASRKDRAVTAFHDIGIRIVKDESGGTGYQIWVGGGLGRTPRIGHMLKDFLPKADLLPYVDAILSVYNRIGRRDNKYKARIKILVEALGVDEARRQVEQQFQEFKQKAAPVDSELLARIADGFSEPDFASAQDYDLEKDMAANPEFAGWVRMNTETHRDPRHIIVSVSLKAHGKPPGDATAEQMRLLAKLAKQSSYDELRVSHEQNVILPHVAKAHLYEVWSALRSAGLATANIGLASDIIACPGLDFCALATARSIPIAQQIANQVQSKRQEQDIGPLKIKISGCINACGHHHVGHIGILGLEKSGKESYQITLGGDGSELASLGERTGPGFSAEQLFVAIDTILSVYLEGRTTREESFIEFYRRVGLPPFKAALYPDQFKEAV